MSDEPLYSNPNHLYLPSSEAEDLAICRGIYADVQSTALSAADRIEGELASLRLAVRLLSCHISDLTERLNELSA